MTISERRNAILSLINTEGSQRATDLAERMNVTTETIRKDLIYLNNKNLLKKGHGCAQPLNEFIERSVNLRSQENTPAKLTIARAARELALDSSVIFIDAGSTLNEMAKIMGPCPHLAIITNSFAAVQSLQETGSTLFFIGGEVSSSTLATSGFWAANELRSVKIDIAFMGSSGFQSHTGPCAKTFADAQLKKEVIGNASKVIVLADSTKFSSNAIMQYADWSEIDLLITDHGVTAEQLVTLEHDVEVLLADDADDHPNG